MEKETIEQSRARIQGYVEKIHLLRKHAGEALIDLIDFLKKSHELRKDLTNIFTSAAEDIKEDMSMTVQIHALLSIEPENLEEDEEINEFISSFKEFSFKAKLMNSEIDSELAEKIEKAAKDFDDAFHKELDPLLGLIADEQRKIEEMQE